MLVHQFSTQDHEEDVQRLREIGSSGGTRGFFLTKSGQDSKSDVTETVKSEKRELSFVVFLGFNGDYDLIQSVKEGREYLFCILIDPQVCDEPKIRLDLFAGGVNMLAKDISAVPTIVERIASWGAPTASAVTKIKTYTCPVCATAGLSEHVIVEHYVTYHMTHSYRSLRTCPICKKGVGGELGRHLHKVHSEVQPPPNGPFPAFSWIVCYNPDTRKFLMTNEKAESAGGIPGYWLPAGRVDPGETFADAAIRETKEEAGVDVELQGILRLMLDDCPRIVFLAYPSDLKAKAKELPDYESVGAAWVSVEDLSKLSRNDYRARDPEYFFPAFLNGEIESHPIGTSEFSKLEALMPSLTTTATDKQVRAFVKAWDKLKQVYPGSTFEESGRTLFA